MKPKVINIGVSFNNVEWNFLFLQDLFFSSDQAIQLIKEYFPSFLLSKIFESHQYVKREIFIQGKPFWVLINSSARECCLYSRHLNFEKVYIDPDLKKGEVEDFVMKFSNFYPEPLLSDWDWVTAQTKLPDFKSEIWLNIEKEIATNALDFSKDISSYSPSVFERFSDYGLKLVAQYSSLRIYLLKFLALLPSLDHDKEGFEVKRAFNESLRRLIEDQSKYDMLSERLPAPLRSLILLVSFIGRMMPAYPLSIVIRFLVKIMASRFIAGESINSSKKTLSSLTRSNRTATLDQLGELVVSEDEADTYLEKVLGIIRGLSLHYQKGEKNAAGLLKAHISIKVSALASQFNPLSFDSTYQRVAPRLKKILILAMKEEVFVNIDAEHYHYRDLVLKIYGKILLETPELSTFDQTGIVVQAYLQDAFVHLKEIHQLASHRKIKMPLRLVKGAYWDAETIEAKSAQLPPPQFLNKEETDLHFRQLAHYILEHGAELQLAIGSHNLFDHLFVEIVRTKFFPTSPIIEHQCLHMTYEALSISLAKRGYPVRNYMPIGDLLVGMAYLVRRIMENSSQVGILSMMRIDESSLVNYKDPFKKLQEKIFSEICPTSFDFIKSNQSFTPVNHIRLFMSENLKLFRRCLESNYPSESNLPPVDGILEVRSSSFEKRIMGKVKFDTFEEVEKKIIHLHENFSNLSLLELENRQNLRHEILTKAGHHLWLDRFNWASLIVLEAGKTWSEALGDVDEAIDFIFYYAEQMKKKTSKRVPIGVISVIAPWNFPLAIPCGMVVGALAAGNNVLLKPAEQTPLIAQKFIELLWQCGFTNEELNIVQGPGEVVGEQLTSSPLVFGVIFTGSKKVGELIFKKITSQNFIHPLTKISHSKVAITEMGGKNAIIVTESADLDEVVSGVLQSSLHHAGQKCSAASRVIIHEKVFNQLSGRLKKAFLDIPMGLPIDPATVVNPLISASDKQRVIEIVNQIKEESGLNLLVDRSQESNHPQLVGPVLVDGRSLANKKDSWAYKEIFAPVVHLFSYRELDEAVELFNTTDYALTGGVFSQTWDDIDYLLEKIQAGNLYVNRSCTGARVGIEPFGGFKMSGTGPKAGGEYYLQGLSLPLIKSINSDDQPLRLNEVNSLSEINFNTVLGETDFLPRYFLKQWRECCLLLVSRFSELRGGLSPKDMEELRSFLDGIDEFFMNKIKTKYTYKIPGQVNYNDYNSHAHHLGFVSEKGFLEGSDIFWIFGLLFSRSPVTLISLSEEDDRIFKILVQVIKQFPLLRSNKRFISLPLKMLDEKISSLDFEVIYLNIQKEERVNSIKNSINQRTFNQHLVKFLDQKQLNPPFSFEQIQNYLFHERTFAINMMRHGASTDTEML